MSSASRRQTAAESLTRLAICMMMVCCVPVTATNSRGGFASKNAGTGDVTLTGWAQVYTELEIYEDRDSMDRHLTYPHCISGLFDHKYMSPHSVYDKKRITVTACS